MSTLDILTRGLFDYAGMFPPAALSFDDALSNSLNFNQSLTRSSLVGSELVVQPEYLENLHLSKQSSGQSEFRICLLGATDNLDGCLETISAYNKANLPSSKIHALELRIESPDLEVMKDIAAAVSQSGVTCFFEPDLSSNNWRDLLEQTTSMLHQLASKQLGFKVRGTGPTAIDNDKLVEVLPLVKDLSFKATAGLHHPIIETQRYGNNLGFVNLATALFLLRAEVELETKDILSVLNCADASEFSFSDQSMSWREFSISATMLDELKNEHHFSIGSCSLHEPDEDLVRLFGSTG